MNEEMKSWREWLKKFSDYQLERYSFRELELLYQTEIVLPYINKRMRELEV